MIKRLSIYAALALAAIGSIPSFAAPITLTTNYAPAPALFSYTITPSQPTFVTFTIDNSRAKPIELQSVSVYHVGVDINFGTYTLNQNGQTYTLWYKEGGFGNPTPISPANGWRIAKTGEPITTASNGITPVIDSINLIICDSSTVYFALVTDSIVYAGGGAPLTPPAYGAANVLLTSFINPGFWIGGFPNNGTQIANRGFWGAVTFDTTLSEVTRPEVKAPVAVCKGETIQLTAQVPEHARCAFSSPVFNWTWPGGSATGDTITVTLDETTIYNCTVTTPVTTASGNTSKPASIKVTALAPEPPLVTGKFAYCINDQFEPLEVLADSVLWYYVPAGGSALPVAPTINTNLGPQKDTFFAAQWKDGCFSDRTRVILSVATKPAKPLVTTPLYYCEGSVAPPLEAVGNDMIWYYFSAGGVPTTIAPTPPTSVKNKFEYFVANTNEGCEGPRERIEVFVEFKPNGLIVPSRERLCEGDTLTFSYYGSAFDSSAFQWSIPDAGLYIDGDKEKGPFTVRFDKAGQYNVTLTVGSGACFSDLYRQMLTIDSIPHADIAAKEEVCADAIETISLKSYDESIESFEWDFGQGSNIMHNITHQGPYGVVWNEPGERVISLAITQGLCSNIINDTILVRPHPDAKIDIDQPSGFNGIYCSGDSIRLRARTINSGTEYTWGPVQYFDSYAQLPASYAIVDFTSYVTLDIKDQYGCINSDSVLIRTEPCCKLSFPTAFSPNNDGRNDRFHLLNIGDMDNYNRTNSLNYDVRNFRVMNRWGVTVFESNNEIEGWDGTFNGEPQDMATYYWFISYMCGDKLMNEKGEVVLVR